MHFDFPRRLMGFNPGAFSLNPSIDRRNNSAIDEAGGARHPASFR
jgi:hypothetical protein